MDKQLLTICRVTGISKTTDNASEFRTCRNCGGITHKTVGTLGTTTFDLTKDNKVHSETVAQPATNILHRDAFRCSHCGESLENYDALQDAVDAALSLHAVSVEGTDFGEYEVGSKDTFKDAIDAASLVISTDNSSQKTIDAAVVSLEVAYATFQSKLKVEGEYTALEAEITSAQALHDAAVEGTDPGQYAVGSKATLQTAIDTAQALVTASASTQAEIDAALSDLQDAVATFESGKV